MTEQTIYKIRYTVNNGMRITEHITGYSELKKRRKEIEKMPGDKVIMVTKDGEEIN